MSTELSSSQEEALGQFCGVTGANEDRAKRMLEACAWNLELAINMHVDTDDSRSNSTAGPSTSTSDQPITIPDSDDLSQDRASQEVRPPIPPVRQVLVQHPAGYSSERQTARRYNTRTGAMSDVYDAFRDFQEEAQWQQMIQEGDASYDTPASSANKRRTLQDLFRPPLEIMFRGSYPSAREVASQQNKWLLVNIQNGREFACQILNRDVWSNQAVKDILKEHFIFWQVYHDSFDGARYVQFYNVSSFPHVSIVDPRTGEQMKSWPTSIDRNSFCDSVIEFLTDKVINDESEKAKDLEGNSQQNNAKEKEKVMEVEKQEAIEKEPNDEKEMVAVDDDEMIEDYKKYLGNDTEKFSDLNVRFPDGTRDQFKLPSDSLMKALFLLLTSKGYGMDRFNYVTNFPRRLLHELPETDTLQAAKLIRDIIFIERRASD